MGIREGIAGDNHLTLLTRPRIHNHRAPPKEETSHSVLSVFEPALRSTEGALKIDGRLRDPFDPRLGDNATLTQQRVIAILVFFDACAAAIANPLDCFDDGCRTELRDDDSRIPPPTSAAMRSSTDFTIDKLTLRISRLTLGDRSNAIALEVREWSRSDDSRLYDVVYASRPPRTHIRG